MEAKAYLKDYIRKTEDILGLLFKEERKRAAGISPITAEMMARYPQFMGGKNIRGALIKLGYECYGGKDEKAILKASIMAEIVHTALLVHDDIMDKDVLRRGMPTMHVQYSSLHRAKRYQGEADHYGLSMAVDMGDIGLVLPQLILADTDFSDEIKTRVLRCFNRQLLATALGQALDVNLELVTKLAEEDILKIHHYKTANYTITGPLQYGALFAGASEKEVEKTEQYGLPVGIAFQLRDDELGLFADEKTLGKPIGSDVKENKNTILHLKALELAKGKERAFIKKTYGKKNLTQNELKRVRQITEQTGALTYSQKMARELVEKGKKFVPQITTNPERQETLYKMADFMVERES